jgi:hypothetical protein
MEEFVQTCNIEKPVKPTVVASPNNAIWYSLLENEKATKKQEIFKNIGFIFDHMVGNLGKKPKNGVLCLEASHGHKTVKINISKETIGFKERHHDAAMAVLCTLYETACMFRDAKVSLVPNPDKDYLSHDAAPDPDTCRVEAFFGRMWTGFTVSLAISREDRSPLEPAPCLQFSRDGLVPLDPRLQRAR